MTRARNRDYKYLGTVACYLSKEQGRDALIRLLQCLLASRLMLSTTSYFCPSFESAAFSRPPVLLLVSLGY